jgi:hypothetical protein
MASVVLQQNSGAAVNGGALLPVDTVFGRNIHAGQGGLSSDGVISSLATGYDAGEGATNIRTANGIQITASTPGPGASAPTSYQHYVSATNTGNLLANEEQLWGSYDPTVSTPTSLEFQRARPVLIGGTAAATASVAVIQPLNQPAPVNWFAAGFAGQFVGTGAPQIVPVPGIPATAIVRYMLVGGTIAAFAAGIAGPAAISVQGNVSFTITATAGSLYNWEILFT